MKRQYIYPPLGFALVLFLGACPPEQTRDTELRAVLKPWFVKEHDWHTKVFEAICELEAKNEIEIPKRLCPGGPGDKGGAPPIPPDFD